MCITVQKGKRMNSVNLITIQYSKQYKARQINEFAQQEL